MLILPTLVLAGCCEPIVIKPDVTFTQTLPTHSLVEGDTVRDLAEKYELRGLEIETANKRFEKMREE